MTLKLARGFARSLARFMAIAFVVATTTTSTACGESCDVTSGLFEPYVAAMTSPETFDTWASQHPNHFTEARVSCLAKMERAAYKREIELLRQCDQHFAGDAEGLDFCRSSVENPETFTAVWSAILFAASGQGGFLETGVGQQIYLIKQDDPAFYNAMWNEILAEFGSEMEEGMQCKSCSKPWYQIF